MVLLRGWTFGFCYQRMVLMDWTFGFCCQRISSLRVHFLKFLFWKNIDKFFKNLRGLFWGSLTLLSWLVNRNDTALLIHLPDSLNILLQSCYIKS
jgi:hypothetical protein